MSTEYANKFINIDFDNILISNNNPLVNSYEHYIKYKEMYLTESNELFTKYSFYSKELQKANEIKNIIISPFKQIYTYISDERINEYKLGLKNIYLEQQSKFKNFMTYINYINTNHKKYISDEYIVDYVPKRPSSIRSITSIRSIESGKRAPSIKSVDSSKRRKNIFTKLVSRT